MARQYSIDDIAKYKAKAGSGYGDWIANLETIKGSGPTQSRLPEEELPPLEPLSELLNSDIPLHIQQAITTYMHYIIISLRVSKFRMDYTIEEEEQTIQPIKVVFEFVLYYRGKPEVVKMLYKDQGILQFTSPDRRATRVDFKQLPTIHHRRIDFQTFILRNFPIRMWTTDTMNQDKMYVTNRLQEFGLLDAELQEFIGLRRPNIIPNTRPPRRGDGYEGSGYSDWIANLNDIKGRGNRPSRISAEPRIINVQPVSHPLLTNVRNLLRIHRDDINGDDIIVDVWLCRVLINNQYQLYIKLALDHNGDTIRVKLTMPTPNTPHFTDINMPIPNEECRDALLNEPNLSLRTFMERNATQTFNNNITYLTNLLWANGILRPGFVVFANQLPPPPPPPPAPLNPPFQPFVPRNPEIYWSKIGRGNTNTRIHPNPEVLRQIEQFTDYDIYELRVYKVVRHQRLNKLYVTIRINVRSIQRIGTMPIIFKITKKENHPIKIRRIREQPMGLHIIAPDIDLTLGEFMEGSDNRISLNSSEYFTSQLANHRLLNTQAMRDFVEQEPINAIPVDPIAQPWVLEDYHGEGYSEWKRNLKRFSKIKDARSTKLRGGAYESNQ